MPMQEAFEANSVAAEQRYMRIMHAATSKAKPGGHKRTDSQADRLTEQLCSVVFDIEQQQRMHVLPRPVYAVSSDGQQATSFSFDRLDAAEAGDTPSCVVNCSKIALQWLSRSSRAQPCVLYPSADSCLTCRMLQSSISNMFVRCIVDCFSPSSLLCIHTKQVFAGMSCRCTCCTTTHAVNIDAVSCLHHAAWYGCLQGGAMVTCMQCHTTNS